MLRFLRKVPFAAAAPAPSAGEWRARGNEALEAGRMDDAANCYRRAADLDPSDPLAPLNLGYVLLEQGDARAAAQALQQALALGPKGTDFAHEAHFLLGRAHRAGGDTDAALASFAAAANLRPDFAQPLEEGVALLQSQLRPEEALAWARRWAQAAPAPASLLALGHCLYELKQHEEALEVVDAVLQQDPQHPAALEGRGSLRLVLGQAQGALADFDAALSQGASIAAAHAGRAAALRRLQRGAEALDATERALAADPAHRDALGLRVSLLLDEFRLQEADALLTRAFTLYPDDIDLRWLRALVRLLAGDYEGGWADYECRRWAPAAGLKTSPPDYGLPQWTGEQDLQGRSILVIGEQGLGDAIQFARYIPLLQERGASVTFHLVPALHSLFEDAFPDCRFVARGDVRKPDFQCLLMSLPLAFRTTVSTIPASVPYLRSRLELRAEWEHRLGPRRGLRVGLVWSGNAGFGNDANRSIALERLRCIDVPNVQFVSLQKEIRTSDADALGAWRALSHHGEHLQSFADTAALADLMDVVISVDTSVAHLAGGLARPLWMLLPYQPDWRWMLEREDSPWYPTARLFRQSGAGDWEGVLARVREELIKLAPTPAA